MNIWLLSATALLPAMIPCLWVCLTGDHCRGAAERFIDTAGYRAAVLEGVQPGTTIPIAASPYRATGMGIGSVLLAAGSAAGALFMFRLPDRRLRQTKAFLDPPIKLLRAVHSGYIGDYALWFMAGASVTLLIAALLPLQINN